MKKFCGVIIYHCADGIAWLLIQFAKHGIISDKVYFDTLLQFHIMDMFEFAVVRLMNRTDYKRFHIEYTK